MLPSFPGDTGLHRPGLYMALVRQFEGLQVAGTRRSHLALHSQETCLLLSAQLDCGNPASWEYLEGAGISTTLC